MKIKTMRSDFRVNPLRIFRFRSKSRDYIIHNSSSDASNSSENIEVEAGTDIGTDTDETDNFTAFVEKIRHDEVSDVYMSSDSTDRVIYQLKEKEHSTDRDSTFIKTNTIMSESLVEEMISHDVQIHIQDASFMSSGVFSVILAAFIYSIMFRFMSTSMINPLQSHDKESIPDDRVSDVELSDVAGIDEILSEVTEFVDFLKFPDKYRKAGAKIPTGCLLHGMPGTGKTMIAKAISNEAGVPFLSCSASEFVELFVGMGASRVRKLFEKARNKSPCIIFIDEIDAIGKRRSYGVAGGNDEREQTLNQILTEMDGFKSNEDIIVFAATNRLDSLDEALIRPGRFDRKIYVPMPNRKSRAKILQTYMNKINAGSINIEELSIKTRGMSGADIMNVVNEAAIISVRQRHIAVSMDHFDKAIDKVSIGIQKKSNEHSAGDSMRVAIHEVGHALVGILQENFDTVDKVSILAIGEAAGITTFLPKETTDLLMTYEYLLQKIKVALGGHAAEETVFGFNQVSSGATSDFEQVSSIAYHLVTKLGYSSAVGKLSLSDRKVSDNTEMIVDQEVKNIVDSCYQETLTIMQTNKDLLHSAAERLITMESMTGADLIDMYNNYISEVE